jgi:hypothetical protein
MYSLSQPLTKEYILSYVTEQQIFEKYLGIPVEFGKKICSPLRKDKHPTCGFAYSKSGNLLFRDFGGHFFGTAFDLVEQLYGLKYCQVLQKIAADFNLSSIEINASRKLPVVNNQVYKEKEFADIRVKRRPWSNKDLDYWKKFGIDAITLKFYNVAACEALWLNGKIIYVYHPSDPAYIYYFGDHQYKIYFPMRDQYRFLCNTASVQGYQQLPEKGDILVITKSMKDIMVLRTMKINAISFQGETVFPSRSIIENLKSRFEAVVTLYDFDYAGVTTANKIRKIYGVPAYFLTNGRLKTHDYLAKDPAEFVEFHGRYNAIDLATKFIDDVTKRFITKNSDPTVHYARQII